MTLRGQRLYVRPVAPEDLPDLRRLTSTDMSLPAEGLLGKLLGETVSFAGIEVVPNLEIRIEQLFVAPPLRRKRIGRAMVGELEQLARRLECPLLVVAHRCDARDFFLRLGFAEVGSVLQKSVSGGLQG